jgi:hypothetical protein
MALLLGWSLYRTVADYGQHVQSEAAYYNFESGAAELASEVNAFLGSGWHEGLRLQVPATMPLCSRQVYLDDRLWRDWASLRYLIPKTQSLTLLSEVGKMAAMSVPDQVRLIVWPYQDYSAHLSLLPLNSLIAVREGPWERGDLEKQARLLCLIYEVTPGASAPTNLQVRFEQGIGLLGYRWQGSAGGLELYLYWQTAHAVGADYTVFVQWRRGSEMIAQSDSYPAGGYYATHLWRPGDIVEDTHLLQTAAVPLPDEGVSVGMYSLQTMTRLQVLDLSGTPIADQVTIELP